MKRVVMFLGVVVLSAAAAFAEQPKSSVTIESVTQRWPWNNKVDIAYTISGGQDVAVNVFCRLVFTATIDGTVYTIDGTRDVGANASNGFHVVTWTPPAGLKAENCTMTAALYSADAPSGDDYMIVDLANGDVVYEGLLATQDASDKRYNTAEYKTNKLVLRKVAAGGTYPTGDDVNTPDTNSRKIWKTDRDYYIGIFHVTQGQYTKLGCENPSQFVSAANDNEVAYRPVDRAMWKTLRVSTRPNEALPRVTQKDTGSFLQRLNFLTGNKLAFDLPTEVMLEIAVRAGTTSSFFWGEDFRDFSYTVCQENSGSMTVAAGSRSPNAWGLFDMVGNVYTWCLDDDSRTDLADAPDPWTPACANNNNLRRIRGGSHSIKGGWGQFKSFHRGAGDPWDKWNANNGFRISCIMD